MRTLTLRLTRTPIPARETTYMCESLELPREHSYHLVASRPELEARDAVHHMILFGCEDPGEQ